MTRDEALAKLGECQQSADPENAHVEADDALCALLESLGFGDVVAEYNKVAKWYA